MARIAGIDLPVQKRLWVGLTSIYGIGQERAKKLAAKAGVDHTKKIRDLTEDEVNHIRQAKIGRASCRERVEMPGVAQTLKKKTRRRKDARDDLNVKGPAEKL